MAKRANKRRSNGNRPRATERPSVSGKRSASSGSCVEAHEDLEDPFFYESPFPPEVVLEQLDDRPVLLTPAMMARRRKLRTFVAMVVGVAAAFVLVGQLLQ